MTRQTVRAGMRPTPPRASGGVIVPFVVAIASIFVIAASIIFLG